MTNPIFSWQLLLAGLLLQAGLKAQEHEPIKYLAAFSVSAAERYLKQGTDVSDEISKTGYITNIWGAFITDQHDLILIGERDPAKPQILLSDVIQAIRTKNKVFSDKENPGVSIMPADSLRYSPTQKVIYSGGVEGTNYGRIVLEGDLLLKLLSMGYIPTNIPGFPSELEIVIDNIKDLRRIATSDKNAGRTWFFPVKVSLREESEFVAVSSVKIGAQCEFDALVSLPDTTLITDESSIKQLLAEDPLRTAALYARFVTEHYDDLAKHFPVLTQMQNLIALSGIFSSLLTDTTSYNGKAFLETGYSMPVVYTPQELPTLSRSANGLAYSYSISGAVRGQFMPDTDPWTTYVLFRTPAYLKEGVLRSRPSAQAISWLIPLYRGEPDEWTGGMLDSLQTAERNRLQHLQDKQALFLPPQDLLAIVQGKPEPVYNEGWKPDTQGKNLLSASGSLVLSTGGQEFNSISRNWAIGAADISAGLQANFQWIIRNKYELALNIPFVVRLQTEDFPFPLIGIDETVTALNAGFENPVLTTRVQLSDGIKHQLWRDPAVILENRVEIPLHLKVFEQYLVGERNYYDYQFPFGQDFWSSAHTVEVDLPFSSHEFFTLSLSLQKYWIKKDRDDDVILDLNYYLQPWRGTDERRHLTFGLHFRKAFYLLSKPLFLQNQGTQVLGSFSYPRKFGNNSFFAGYQIPGKSDRTVVSGGMIVGVQLGGNRLFDWRRWYD